MREVPAVKAPESPQDYDDFFTISFESEGGKILGLYQARDQYLFASKVVRDAGTPQPPFEMVKGIKFQLPYNDIKMVDLDVTYNSLQGTSIPSYKREDLSQAVTVLARGFDGNDEWGLALATLVGATSDAIKSFGMESHVCRGLNIKSDANHVPSERLLRINKNWSNISKSIRNGKYDYVLKYTNENGEEVNEDITRFSAGLILAVINFKDGTKREKTARKLEKKDLGKRKRDEKEEREGEGSRKSTGTSGRKTNKRRKRNVPGTQKNYGAVVEDESETLKSPKPFCMRMTPRYVHYSSSSSDSSYFSDSDSEAIAEESELQKEFFPEDTAKELEFLPKAAPEEDKTPAEPEEDKLVLVQVAKSDGAAPSVLPYKSFLADSDSEAIAEESELQKEFFPEDSAKELEFLPEAAPEEDKTPAEPEEDKLVLVQVAKSDGAAPSVLIDLDKSSTTGLVSASSILVKHSERTKEMASQAEDSE